MKSLLFIDASLWNNYQPRPIMVTTNDAATPANDAVTPINDNSPSSNSSIPVMILASIPTASFPVGQKPVDRYPQCPKVNESISYALSSVNNTYAKDFGLAMAVLKGVEVDFNCAGYCMDPPSIFRAFSWIKNGPAAHNCTHQINEWVDNATSRTATYAWIFFGITTFCFAYVLAFACRKHDHLSSPLLRYKNN